MSKLSILLCFILLGTQPACASGQKRQESDSKKNSPVESVEPEKAPSETKVQESKKPKWLTHIKSVIAHYNDQTALEMNITKKEVLELLEEEKESEGTFLFSKGNIRFEIKKPEWNLVVLNKGQITLATKLPEDFGGKTQVTIIKSAELGKKTTAPLVLLLSDASAWEKFKLVAKEKKSGKSYYSLVPVLPKEFPEVSKIKLSLKSDNLIEAISYEDTIGNKSIFGFSNIRIKKVLKKNSFDYKPPKNSEVSYH